MGSNKLNYYLISDSKSIQDDIEFFKKHSIQTIHKENGIVLIDIKNVRLIIDEGLDEIELELGEKI